MQSDCLLKGRLVQHWPI